MRQKILLSLFVGICVVSSHVRAAGPSDAQTVLHVGPGFLVGGGAARPGVGLGIATKVTRVPLYLGVDSGAFFLTSPSVNISIPLLPFVYYRFPTKGELIPTIGAAVGPVLTFGNGAQTLEIMMMINPGFQFYLDTDMDLFFRTSLGLIGSSFQFYPQIGATFRI